MLQPLIKLRPMYLLTGGVDSASKDWETSHLLYLRHLIKMMPSTFTDAFDAYKDYLQMPLQPLRDNLENMTYETFERDTIKYKRYEQAIQAALLDRPANEATT